MKIKQAIFFLLALSALQFANGQGGATIKAKVDKTRIQLGEPFYLTLDAYISTGSASQFPAITTIDHFEMLEQPKEQTTDAEGGTNVTKTYKLTSFDSGRWVIPPYRIAKGFETDSIPIDVVYTSDFNPALDYNDIKDIIVVEPKKKKFPWWWIAGGAVVLTAIVIYIYKRPKKKSFVAPVVRPRVNPYEYAMQELAILAKDKPAAKQFHSRLIDIFRMYLFQRKGILSLQKTTDDLVVQLKSLDFPGEQYQKLSQALGLSDYVKFAKYVTSTEEDQQAFDEIKKAITTIENASVAKPS